jgi:cardiolipin synthase
MFKSATNYRLHRKAIIIDNKCAFYGGSNIGDEYLSIDPKKYY